MVQSPSWEANRFAASQEIPRISQNPKVHYRTHKRPPPFSILGQPNPVHISTSHPLKIHPNIIHPSTPRSPQWSPSLRFSQHDPLHPPLLSSCTFINMTCLSFALLRICQFHSSVKVYIGVLQQIAVSRTMYCWTNFLFDSARLKYGQMYGPRHLLPRLHLM